MSYQTQLSQCDIRLCLLLAAIVLSFSLPHQKAVAAITAHDTPLAALAFNVTGTKLATASTTVSLDWCVCVCVCVCVGGWVGG